MTRRLIYQTYSVSEELMRRACYVGPLTLAEAERRGRADAELEAEKQAARVRLLLGTIATTGGLVPGDSVKIGDKEFVLQ